MFSIIFSWKAQVDIYAHIEKDSLLHSHGKNLPKYSIKCLVNWTCIPITISILYKQTYVYAYTGHYIYILYILPHKPKVTGLKFTAPLPKRWHIYIF